MRKDLGKKAYLFPMPVLVLGTYNQDGTTDAMTAAWGSIADYYKVAIYLSEEHRTFKNIEDRKAFTVSFGDVNNVVACDFVGIVSLNNDCDKMKKSGLVAIKSDKVNAPVFENFPLTLECKLDSIDYETGCVVGDIVNVLADESILTDDKIDMSKFKPIAYNSPDHGYYALGERVGNAYSDGKKLK